ncbi:hypothetical protein SAY87_031650 [Trapa incisa]|uniref:Uncharacterized protein n=1 Tax=Trapa incisa TaxID=236973 RepID=A0AAN7KKX8_9MYRT|nr:hypothetical protein SAY87_031650 [Trapa incisa]
MEDNLKYACDANSSATEGYGRRIFENDDVVLEWRDYFDHHTLPLSRQNLSRWPHHPTCYRSLTVLMVSIDLVASSSQLIGFKLHILRFGLEILDFELVS